MTEGRECHLFLAENRAVLSGNRRFSWREIALPPSLLKKSVFLKWYYDQKITFIFSSDFETMFVKHSPSEIISLNFEKKTVNLNCTFQV